jgi:hypothetical protein
MNWATLLNTPVGELLGKKKQDLRQREANKPPIGSTICCAGLRITVQAGLSDELWRWLVSLGWRELKPGEHGSSSAAADWPRDAHVRLESTDWNGCCLAPFVRSRASRSCGPSNAFLPPYQRAS